MNLDKVFNVLGRVSLGLLVFTAVVCLVLSQFKIVGDFERIEFNPHIPFLGSNNE